MLNNSTLHRNFEIFIKENSIGSSQLNLYQIDADVFLNADSESPHITQG